MIDLAINVFFDSCAFNPSQVLEKDATSEVLKLRKEEKIIIIIPDKADEELSKAPPRITKHRIETFFTYPLSSSVGEKKTKLEIRRLLFGDKQDLAPNESNDIDNISKAVKYGGRYFVTVDKKHILKKASEIEKRYYIKVMAPSKCLREIRERLLLYSQEST